MILGITDVETTGLSSEENDMIEVAMLIYDTETQTILESYQSLLHGTENPCEEINKISPEALKKMPKEQKDDAKELLVSMADGCEFMIAHNAPFDRGFYEANGIKFKTPWACSKADIKYPGSHKSSRLGHLCYDFDIPVLKAHSALHDCYILVELLKKVPDLEEQLKLSLEPKATYMALVDIENKDLAKERGFHWNREKKQWLKDLRDSEVKALKEERVIKIRKAR